MNGTYTDGCHSPMWELSRCTRYRQSCPQVLARPSCPQGTNGPHWSPVHFGQHNTHLRVEVVVEFIHFNPVRKGELLLVCRARVEVMVSRALSAEVVLLHVNALHAPGPMLIEQEFTTIRAKPLEIFDVIHHIIDELDLVAVRRKCKGAARFLGRRVVKDDASFRSTDAVHRFATRSPIPWGPSHSDEHGLHSRVKAIQRPTLPSEAVHDVHRRDGLALRVFAVGAGVANHVFLRATTKTA